jgi:hypothetical protein
MYQQTYDRENHDLIQRSKPSDLISMNVSVIHAKGMIIVFQPEEQMFVANVSDSRSLRPCDISNAIHEDEHSVCNASEKQRIEYGIKNFLTFLVALRRLRTTGFVDFPKVQGMATLMLGWTKD